MKCKKCGNNQFHADQRCVVSVPVIVDGNGEFMANSTEDWASFTMDCDNPEGPYLCTKCGEEYDPA